MAVVQTASVPHYNSCSTCCAYGINSVLSTVIFFCVAWSGSLGDLPQTVGGAAQAEWGEEQSDRVVPE